MVLGGGFRVTALLWSSSPSAVQCTIRSATAGRRTVLNNPANQDHLAKELPS
jgi:hypothetical protein